MDEALWRVCQAVSRTGGSARADAAARASRRLGEEFAGVSCRREGHGHAGKLGQDAECIGEKQSVADRRIGGPSEIEQEKSGGSGGGSVLSPAIRRTQSAFRRERAPHGRVA